MPDTTTDQIQVQIVAEIKGLLAGMQQSADAVNKTATSISSDVQRIARQSVVSSEQSAVAFEGMGRRLEHVGVQSAFALNALTDGSERGLTRLAHSVAFLGGEFGPVGLAVSTFVAIAGEGLLRWFAQAQKDAEATAKKIRQEIGDLANQANVDELTAKLKTLAFGQPLDKDGNLRKVVGEMTIAGQTVKIFEGSLADLENRFSELSKKMPADASMASGQIARDWNALVPELDKARQQFADIRAAIQAVQDQAAAPSPADIAKLSGTLVSEDSPEKTAKLVQEARDKALAELEKSKDAMLKVAFKGFKEFADGEKKWSEEVQKINTETTIGLGEDWQRYSARIQKLNKDTADAAKRDLESFQHEVAAQWMQVFDTMDRAFAQTVRKMQQTGGTFRDFTRVLLQQVAQDFALMELKILESHLAGWLARQWITRAGLLEEVAQYTWAAIKIVGTIAAEIYGSAFLWALQHGFDPITAGVVGLAAAGVAIGGAAAIIAKSAAGGYDVPAGLNPVTQLHAREMVLPARYADVIRGAAEGGGGFGGRVVVNISAIDAAGVAQWANRNKSAIGRAALAYLDAGGAPSSAVGRRPR